MKESLDKGPKMALNRVIKEFVVPNLYLQSIGRDVAIPYLAGPPGMAKTAILYSMTKSFDWGILSTHLGLKAIEELTGLPKFDKITINGKELDGTSWTYSDVLGELYKLSEQYNQKEKLVAWLLDDIHLLGPSMMAIMYELLTERKLKEFKLPDNVAIVMAGNTSTKAGAKTMYSAIINRCAMMPVYADFDYWRENYAIPNGIHGSVVSFLGNEQYRSSYFHEDEQIDVPWASPRSWSRLSHMVTNTENWNKKKLTIDSMMYIANAHVGKLAASEYANYYQIYSKFDIDKILENYKNFKISDDANKAVEIYAMGFALVSKYIGMGDVNRKKVSLNFSHILNVYLQKRKEIGISMLKDIISLEKAIQKNNITTDILSHLTKLDPAITNQVITAFNLIES